MTTHAYALIGMTALVAALVGVLTFAALRFLSAARDAGGTLRQADRETAWMSAALQDALVRLKAQEQAMAARAEASEQLSDAIIASLTSGLLMVDLARRVRIVNPAGRRLLRLPETAGEETDYREVLAHVAPVVSVIDECLADGRAITRRALDVGTDGQDACLGVTVSPLYDKSHAPAGAICLFSDLTAVRALEAQIRLKESLAQVGELTAGLAHEFRNGLATIHGYSRLIDPEALPESYRPYVQAIRGETDALGEVVTNFLAFARPAALTLARVELREVVDRVVDDARADCRGRGGDIEVRGSFAVIDGDEVLLRQALANLLRNAIEACAAHGVPPAILVEGAVDPARQLVRLTVADNGPGIDPAARQRLFQPFFTTKGDGTGLGLAIVQKIVVSHNGRVTLTGSPLGGAALQMVFPVSPA